jgi:hypothetical protein
MEDEGGPSGSGCRIRSQTAWRCVRIRSQVVSGPGKGEARPRQARTRKANVSEPLMSCRKVTDVIETGLRYQVRDRVWGKPFYCPDGGWQKGGASLVQAYMWNVGTWRSDVKGETQEEEPARVRVPMRGAGADQPAAAMKSGNADGAKGLNCPALFVSQPAMGGAYG